jgi:hypothetical protein
MYKWLLGAVALAAVALPARADFIVTISANGQTETYDQAVANGPVTATGNATASGTVVPATPGNGNGFTIVGANVGGYTIFTQAQDNNSPGQPLEADINLSQNTVKRTGAGGTLTITEGTTGPGYASFTQPTGNTQFKATVGTTPVAGDNYSLSQTGFLNATPETTQSVNQSSIGNSVQTKAVTTTSPFNLSQTVTLSGLGSGSTVSLNTADVQVDFVVPEPASALLALLGAPVLGFLGWRKRRAKAA